MLMSARLTRRSVLIGSGGAALGLAVGSQPAAASIVDRTLEAEHCAKLSARLESKGFRRTYRDRVRPTRLDGRPTTVSYIGYARPDGASAVLIDLASDPGAGGATILDTRANGSTRLSTFKISPSGDVVKRLYALPYPIPGDRDDPWLTELGLTPATTRMPNRSSR
jgi:hypothetical protein